MSNEETSPPAHADFGLALERSTHKVTIRGAKLAVQAARSQGHPEELAMALIRLAHLHFRQGRYSQTRLLAAEVMRDAPADSAMRCDALRMLGNCAAELGDPQGAEVYYHQAVDLARQLDYAYGLYKCLHSLATNIYWPRGQFELCLAAGKEALSQAQALNLGEELWFPLADIAWAYWSTGQLEAANHIADQIESVVSPGSLGEGFYCCLRAGLVEPGADTLKTALALYERARSIAEATGDPGLNVEVRLGFCRCYRTAGDLPAASAWAEDAVAVSVRMEYCQFQGIALIERGRIRIEKGDLEGAEKDMRAAQEIAARQGANFDLTSACLYLAVLLSAQQSGAAITVWEQAIRLILDNGYDFLIEQERGLIMPWIADNLNSSDPLPAKISAAFFDRLARAAPAKLTIKTFGQLCLQTGSRTVANENLRQRRAGELLALLLSSPRYTLSSEQVIEAMCPEKDPCAAVDFYHHAISALRRLLEPDLPDRRFPCRYLDVSEERVTLIVPPGSRIDFLEFEQCVLNKDWEQAIRIYQGEYLPVYGYASWSLNLRQHFADQFEQALLSLAAERLNSGAAPDCLNLARRALLHNAWQEQAVELGMRAALAMGDRVTAIKLYQRLEKTLERDLGLAPQNELQQLYSTVRKRPREK